ncbi:MAG: hypothetical protein ACRCYY_21075 [Trueperaceae bacterium]
MILWINGPFGVGKTTLTTTLHHRIQNSFIFDPETIGFMLRDTLSSENFPDDFQDVVIWRRSVVQTLLELRGTKPKFAVHLNAEKATGELEKEIMRHIRT